MNRPVARTESVVSVFGEEHVVRLTGLSRQQLRYWDKTGFFKPSRRTGETGAPYGRVYSFRDVVGLRVLALLRKRHHVSLQHLRKVAAKLGELKDGLWSKTRLYVLNREVYFQEPATGRIRSALRGQYAMIALTEIIGDIRDEAERLKHRAAAQIGAIERRRFVAHNTWVLAGTRISTGAIKRFHEAGFSAAQILKEYPTLTKHDIAAALTHERKHTKSA